MTRPRPSAVAFRPDGSSYMVDEVGNPVPDGQRIVLTAADLARTVAGYVAAERQAGSESTAALLQATADAAAQATAQAAFVAGQRHAVAEVMAKSRVRRTVERDADGKVIGSIETREPLPEKPEKPEEPAREPMGFRPRRPR